MLVIVGKEKMDNIDIVVNVLARAFMLIPLCIGGGLGIGLVIIVIIWGNRSSENWVKQHPDYIDDGQGDAMMNAVLKDIEERRSGGYL